MAVNQFNLANGQRAARKLLITVAEWTEMRTPSGGGDPVATPVREILGTRVEDSSIEYNAEVETMTDVRGITYTDVNKTEPQQDFDDQPILGGSELQAKLNDIRSRNALTELNQFTVYIITAFVGSATNGYAAEKHENCTIAYQSLGGDSHVNMPIEVHLSNYANGVAEPQLGTVDKLTPDFKFTPDAKLGN